MTTSFWDSNINSASSMADAAKTNIDTSTGASAMSLVGKEAFELDSEISSLSNKAKSGSGDVTTAQLTVATLRIGQQQAETEMAKGVAKSVEKQIQKAGQMMQQG